MSSPHDRSYEQLTVTIPADIERPDRILAGLTVRQLAILIPGIALVWGSYLAVHTLVPVTVFAVFAVPALGAVAALALAERDGTGLDQLALHAVAYARHPRRLVPAPSDLPNLPAWASAQEQAGPSPAPLRLPACAVGARGTLDLGGNGVAVIVACTTVSFTLRTPNEQAALVGAFGGWLNSLSGPVQILVQAAPIDLAPAIASLRGQAAALPHPALEEAALDHAHFLTELAATRDLLARRVLIVIREPASRAPLSGPAASAGRIGRADAGSRTSDHHKGVVDAAGARALRRADQTVRALAAAGVAATILDASQAAAALAAAADPTAPASTGPGSHPAAPHEPVTASPSSALGGGWTT